MCTTRAHSCRYGDALMFYVVFFLYNKNRRGSTSNKLKSVSLVVVDDGDEKWVARRCGHRPSGRQMNWELHRYYTVTW